MRVEDDETEDEREWRFSVDDFPDPNEEDGSNEGGNSNGAVNTDSNEYEDDRLSRPRQPLEPGPISLENAFFVLVGIAIVAGLVIGALLGF